MSPRRHGMKLDSEIDDFVNAVNRGPRERGDADEVPPSVASSGPDEYGLFDWQIRPAPHVSWIPEVEATLPAPLPPSYRSFVTRYVFPAFEIPGAFLFANTPEGSTHDELFVSVSRLLKNSWQRGDSCSSPTRFSTTTMRFASLRASDRVAGSFRSSEWTTKTSFSEGAGPR